MDNSVWLQGQDMVAGGSDGDVVLIPEGDMVRIAEVSDGELTDCAEVAASLLPGLPSSTGDAQQITDEDLLRAVSGVITAERDRGA